MSHLKARPLSSKRLKKSTDNSNPLTIQQYNNFINIDTSKNNITIDEVKLKKAEEGGGRREEGGGKREEGEGRREEIGDGEV